MKSFFKAIITLLVLTLLFTPILASIITGNYLHQFFLASGLSFSQVVQIVSSAQKNSPSVATTPTNILVLGLDQRSDSLEDTDLTDSIIFASFLPSTATATLIPIPRDLWLPDLQTKINALYYYGQKNGQGPLYVTSQVTNLVGLPINHYLVLDYHRLPEFIDLLGGVDIDIENSFTDTTYPNPEHITNPQTTTYITIQFTRGPTHLTGSTALQYVRSRTSADPLESGDGARSRRQLRLIAALAAKLTTPVVLANPTLLGQAYKFFHLAIQTDLEDSNLLALALATWPNRAITISAIPIPTNLLVNPPISKYGQWVYEQVKPDALKQFFSLHLGL